MTFEKPKAVHVRFDGAEVDEPKSELPDALLGLCLFCPHERHTGRCAKSAHVFPGGCECAYSSKLVVGERTQTMKPLAPHVPGGFPVVVGPPAPTTKIFICGTSRTNEYGEGCEYAAVTLTPALVAKILARRAIFLEAKAKDTELSEMYFWDGMVDFYGIPPGVYAPAEVDGKKNLDSEAFENDLGDLQHRDEADWESTTADLSVFAVARTECDQMIVREAGVAWTCIPKHSNFYVITQELPYDLVERAR